MYLVLDISLRLVEDVDRRVHVVISGGNKLDTGLEIILIFSYFKKLGINRFSQLFQAESKVYLLFKDHG